MSNPVPKPTPSTALQVKLTAQAEAILYFIGLVLVYFASYAPSISSAAPNEVRTFFMFLGAAVIVIKYELSQFPKPQITSHQVMYATLALTLSVLGGQMSNYYAAYWWCGLLVALIGAILAAYEDLGGQIPSPTVSTTTPSPTA